MFGKISKIFYKKINQVKYAKLIGVNIGKNCRLLNCDFSTEPYLISIGDHVSATKVRFETHDGGVWVIRDKYPEIDIIKPIKIHNNVYIGYGSVIMPGVEVGENSIIGAYSVVTKNVPPNVVVAGIPAKQIKTLDQYVEKALKSSEKTKLMTKVEKENFYFRKFLNGQ